MGEVGLFIEVWKILEVIDLGKIKNLVYIMFSLKFFNICLVSRWIYKY